MIPSVFVMLDALPLTPNGKVDRRALPVPNTSELESEASYVIPRTAVEEGLSAIWSEVLSTERTGVNDNFFDLGGHSLLATQIISRVRQAFSDRLPLRHLFEGPTSRSSRFTSKTLCQRNASRRCYRRRNSTTRHRFRSRSRDFGSSISLSQTSRV